MEDKINWDFKNMIGSLPEEIIEDILKRLPVKSLNRFRCVSKSWLFLILSPEFIKTHFNHHSANNPRIMFTNMLTPTHELKHGSIHSLFLEHESTVASDTDHPMKGPNRQVRVMGSCNGIICLVVDESHIFLWNPSLRTSKKLPPLSLKLNYYDYGFGFHKCGGDYKVVVISCKFNPRSGVDELKRYIYSNNDDSWKKIKGVKAAGSLMWDYTGKYASGKFHFTVRPRPDEDPEEIILSIDSRNGVFGIVEEPDYGSSEIGNLLGVLGGCICVFVNHWGGRVCDVWVMKEYSVKESWTKLFSIPSCDEVPGWRPNNIEPLYSGPLVMLPNGEVLLLCGGMHFVVYNPKDNRVRCPHIPNVLLDCLSLPHVYVESLVTL